MLGFRGLGVRGVGFRVVKKLKELPRKFHDVHQHPPLHPHVVGFESAMQTRALCPDSRRGI